MLSVCVMSGSFISNHRHNTNDVPYPPVRNAQCIMNILETLILRICFHMHHLFLALLYRSNRVSFASTAAIPTIYGTKDTLLKVGARQIPFPLPLALALRKCLHVDTGCQSPAYGPLVELYQGQEVSSRSSPSKTRSASAPSRVKSRPGFRRPRGSSRRTRSITTR